MSKSSSPSTRLLRRCQDQFPASGPPPGADKLVRRITARITLPPFIVLSFIALSLPGCATTDANRTRAEAAGLGAALGMAIGYVASGDRKVGAAAGGLAGAAIGALLGQKVVDRKAQLAAQEDALLASASQAQQVAERAREENARLHAQLAALQEQAQALQDKTLSAEARSETMIGLRRQAQESLAQLDQALVSVRTEIATQQKLLADHASTSANAGNAVQTASSGGLALVANNLHELQSQESQLAETRRQLDRLRSIDHRSAY